LLRAYADQPRRDAELRGWALGREPIRPGVNVATVGAVEEAQVDRLTVDPVRLHAAGVASGRRMLRALGAGEDWTLPPP
jgi:hypothetical protein